MANPFLVLGGIAVGIITATFGVLSVPGWVESAQDAAAVNDLSNLRAAQAKHAAETGSYASDLAPFTAAGVVAERSVATWTVVLGRARDRL